MIQTERKAMRDFYFRNVTRTFAGDKKKKKKNLTLLNIIFFEITTQYDTQKKMWYSGNQKSFL